MRTEILRWTLSIALATRLWAGLPSAGSAEDVPTPLPIEVQKHTSGSSASITPGTTPAAAIPTCGRR